ncbi:MAG: cysteine synthase A [Candidatus Gastranaerophilales bacterium]|nr:cysteine synthase A [Candidatus Gastranaerophilales bacterium]
MTIYNNILELTGNTPLVKINRLNTGHANILAKVEYFNPAGSIKDRIALSMIDDAQNKGLINESTTIIEPTSGNTGIGLALVCAVRGYKLILTMPESMSKERRDILKIYGAQLVLTPAASGMQGAVDKANELNKEIKNSIILQQFNNPANPKMHYEKTALEIWNDTNGKVDIIVAGVGTGGTISGIAKKLKELNPNIKAVALEPETSPVLSKGSAGAHKIQGIGANFVPDNFNRDVVDEIICISNEDAFKYAKELALQEGIFAGISSGCAVYGAILLSQREENKDKNIVVILPDTGMRYMSSPAFIE